MVLLISWLFPIVVVRYLIMVNRLITKLKYEHLKDWEQLGSPNLSNPNGQFIVFWKIIYGAGLPESITHSCRKQLRAVRILLFLGLILFVVIVAMMYGGTFNKLK